MDGWVGHVGWPIADGWTTKWSPIQLAVWRRIGKVRSWDHYATPPTISSFLDLLVFVFTTSICIPYRSLSVCNLWTVSCNFSLLCSIISMSSANLRLFTRLPWTLHCFLYSWFYPLFSPGTKQMIVVTVDLLVPTVIWNHSLRCPLTNTANCVSL